LTTTIEFSGLIRLSSDEKWPSLVLAGIFGPIRANISDPDTGLRLFIVPLLLGKQLVSG
jgi:hypothetical protein